MATPLTFQQNQQEDDNSVLYAGLTLVGLYGIYYYMNMPCDDSIVEPLTLASASNLGKQKSIQAGIQILNSDRFRDPRGFKGGFLSNKGREGETIAVKNKLTHPFGQSRAVRLGVLAETEADPGSFNNNLTRADQ